MKKSYIQSIFAGAVVALILAGTATATHIFTSTAEDAIETMLSSTSECCEFDGTTAGQSAIRANMLFVADNTYDIGASGANRPRDFYLGRNLILGSGNEITGNLIVSGIGPGVVGSSSASDFRRLYLTGSFTSLGGSNRLAALEVDGQLTAANGDISWQTGVAFGTTIITQGNSETIPIISQLRLEDPGITVGSGDTVTRTATLHIQGVATQGTQDYAIYSETGGYVFFAGDVGIGANADKTTQGLVPLHVTNTSGIAALGDPYIQLGGGELDANGDVATIGFGDLANSSDKPPAEIGFIVVSNTDNTFGDLIFTTRSVTTDTVATERVRIDNTGTLHIGDTTHGSITIGLNVNMSTNDGMLVALKSTTDVATGLTTAVIGSNVETDDIYTIQKNGDLTGGVIVQVLAESTLVTPYIMDIYGGAPATTNATTSLGSANWFVAVHDNSNDVTDMAANSNAFAWGELDTSAVRQTRMLLKADDGELWVGGGLKLFSDGGGDIGNTGANRVNDIHMTGRLEHDRQSVTVDSATTFAITSDYVLLACTDAETIDTITGGLEGTRLIIEHTDTDCTLNDDNDSTASNAIDLTGSGNDVGAVAKFIMLVYNGSHWSQLAESDN